MAVVELALSTAESADPFFEHYAGEVLKSQLLRSQTLARLTFVGVLASGGAAVYFHFADEGIISISFPQCSGSWHSSILPTPCTGSLWKRRLYRPTIYNFSVCRSSYLTRSFTRNGALFSPALSARQKMNASCLRMRFRSICGPIVPICRSSPICRR